MNSKRSRAILIVLILVPLLVGPQPGLCTGRLAKCAAMDSTLRSHCSNKPVPTDSACNQCHPKVENSTLANSQTCKCCLQNTPQSEGLPPERISGSTPQLTLHHNHHFLSAARASISDAGIRGTGGLDPPGPDLPDVLQLSSLLRI